MTQELPPPLALAMIICDAIWTDPSTGKLTLLGAFSGIGARSFPAVHPMIAVHVALTDSQGPVPIRLQLIDVNEDADPLFTAESELDFPDRRATVVMNLHMANIRFPRPGEYRLQLFARNEFLMERRLLIEQIGEGQSN